MCGWYRRGCAPNIGSGRNPPIRVAIIAVVWIWVVSVIRISRICVIGPTKTEPKPKATPVKGTVEPASIAVVPTRKSHSNRVTPYNMASTTTLCESICSQ
jgi:hypothetical protein